MLAKKKGRYHILPAQCDPIVNDVRSFDDPKERGEGRILLAIGEGPR